MHARFMAYATYFFDNAGKVPMQKRRIALVSRNRSSEARANQPGEWLEGYWCAILSGMETANCPH
jgi:hypothetical protein